jgi:hypothetical protein
MGRSFLTCPREAERFFQDGHRAQVRKRLEEALRELRRPMQRLPTWVVPGVNVQWIGDPPHHVYKVVAVFRDTPDWAFQSERICADGSKELMTFHRGAGKRYWRRHV